MDISMAITMDDSAVGGKKARKKKEKRREKLSIFETLVIIKSTFFTRNAWTRLLEDANPPGGRYSMFILHTQGRETRALGTVTCCAAATTGAKRTSAILFTCVLYPYPYLERSIPPSPIMLLMLS
jgi:hypothetical protein